MSFYYLGFEHDFDHCYTCNVYVEDQWFLTALLSNRVLFLIP